MSSLFVKPLPFTVVSANQNAIALASNANIDEPGLVWRSNNLTTINVIIDLGADAGEYDTVALIGTNLRATDTVQIRNGATNTGIGTYTGLANAAWSGVKPDTATAKAIYKVGTQTQRYIRIDIVATSHPDAYVQVQRIVVGKALELNDMAGVDLGHEITFDDQSVMYNGPGWTDFDEYPVLAQMKFTVSMISDPDWRSQWYGFLQWAGVHKAFLVVPDDTQPDNWQAEAIYGRCKDRPIAIQTAYGIRRTDLTVSALAQ